MMLYIEVMSSGPGPSFAKSGVDVASAIRIMEYLTVFVLLAAPRDGVAVIIRRVE